MTEKYNTLSDIQKAYNALPGIKKARVLQVIAVVIMLPALIRGVTGYYSSDLVWMLPLLVAGGVIAFVGNRVKDRNTET